MLTGPGFVGVTFYGWTGYLASSQTEGALVTGRKLEAVPHERRP